MTEAVIPADVGTTRKLINTFGKPLCRSIIALTVGAKLDSTEDILKRARAEIEDPELQVFIPDERWDDIIARLKEAEENLRDLGEKKIDSFPESWKKGSHAEARRALLGAEKIHRMTKSTSNAARFTQASEKRLEAIEKDRYAESRVKEEAIIDADRRAVEEDRLVYRRAAKDFKEGENVDQRSDRDTDALGTAKARGAKDCDRRARKPTAGANHRSRKPAGDAVRQVHKPAKAGEHCPAEGHKPQTNKEELQRVAEAEAARMNIIHACHEIPGLDIRMFLGVLIKIMVAKRSGHSIPSKEFRAMVLSCIKEQGASTKRGGRPLPISAPSEKIIAELTTSLTEFACSTRA